MAHVGGGRCKDQGASGITVGKEGAPVKKHQVSGHTGVHPGGSGHQGQDTAGRHPMEKRDKAIVAP